jgi:hypothetical protein
MERHGHFTVSLRDDLSAGIEMKASDGEIILNGLPARPLVVAGRFQLADPHGRLTLTGPGTYTSSGEGSPIRLTLETEKVVVRP